MDSFSDYNPNYEERRGGYKPASLRTRLQDAGQAHGNRQNTGVPADGLVPERQQDEPEEPETPEED